MTLSHVTDLSWPIALFGLSTIDITLSHPMASDQNSTVDANNMVSSQVHTVMVA
jgi:hypothetical protein